MPEVLDKDISEIWSKQKITMEDIREIEEASYTVIDKLRSTVFQPDGKKDLERRFSITEAAEMVGRTPTAIRNAEEDGRLTPPELTSNNRRSYTLEQVNIMRNEFGTLPWRNLDTDEPAILAIQNFKGGVGKSTITAHLAQYLGLKGYRVCVVDCDPQGSTTSLFGINPDYDLEQEDTMVPYFVGEKETLSYAIRETYWHQVDLIPTNLSAYNLEYFISSGVKEENNLLDKLRIGLLDIASKYDVILVDPPPALGMISLSVLRAANGLIVPCRPATIDFTSTAHFFTMLIEAMDSLKKYGLSGEYNFLKVLVNDVDEGKSAHRNIATMMKQVYRDNMVSILMRDSAEIDNACGRLMTVYELTKPITSRDVHKRAKTFLDSVNKEVETLIRKTWPSHEKQLSEEGLI